MFRIRRYTVASCHVFLNIRPSPSHEASLVHEVAGHAGVEVDRHSHALCLHWHLHPGRSGELLHRHPHHGTLLRLEHWLVHRLAGLLEHRLAGLLERELLRLLENL